MPAIISKVKQPETCPTCWSDRTEMLSGWIQYVECKDGKAVMPRGDTYFRCLACGSDYAWKK